jgi:hypothetical protein
VPRDDEDDRPRRRPRDEYDDEDEDDRPRPRRRNEDEYDGEDDYDRPRRRGRRRLSREQLRGIAGNQKAIILCVFIYLCLIPAQFLLPENIRPLLGLALIPLGIAAAVFIFLLATKIYSQGTGILLGILTLFPCVGLIVLLIINQKATSILKEHGVSVGLFGASSSNI